MGVGAGLYMYVVVVQMFTFAISSRDEFLSHQDGVTFNAAKRLVGCENFATIDKIISIYLANYTI